MPAKDPSKKPSNHYIDNTQFLEAITAYRKLVRAWHRQGGSKPNSGIAKPRVPEYIGDCILQIAQHLSFKPNFINYSYKEEMISDGIENCLLYLDNFDPKVSKNPFAYFTQIIYFAFLRRIGKEKKQAFIRYQAMRAADRQGSFQEWVKREGSFNGDAPDPYAGYLKLTANDIKQFEARTVKKKRKKKSKMGSLEDLMTDTPGDSDCGT